MRKERLPYLILIFCFVFYSCKDDSNVNSLELSVSTFNDVSSDGSTLKVDITCNDAWTASSSANTWCKVTPQTGVENQTLTIQVSENLNQTPRTATITVISNEIRKELKISQKAASAPINLETYHYKLPVIFHVLYNDKNDKKQYVEADRFPKILQRVNELYKHAGDNSADMNLEFFLATEDPTGKTLAEPGVERIEWNTSTIDIEDFMFNNDQKYNHLIWEPNDYINVMIYTFTDNDIMGVSTFPYTPEAHPLDGTETVTYHLKGENLKYAYCISLNNNFIYEESLAGKLNQSDAAITLSHELGHYLGLFHVFSEAPQDNGIDVCKDTDYCNDTQTYNRKEYEAWVASLSGKDFTYEDLLRRYDCVRSTSFFSQNIMDYAFSFLNQFTQEQRERVRHILNYSSLIPGPKKDQISTRTVHDGVLDLPIHVMK